MTARQNGAGSGLTAMRGKTLRRRAMPVSLFSHPRLVSHRVADPGWGLDDLRIAVLADLHICSPWTPLGSLRRIVAATNALGADLIVIAGDFIVDRRMPARAVAAGPIIAALAPLAAPLGVAAVLGNHDWSDCALAQATGFARNAVAEALAGSAIRLLSNAAIPISHGKGTFWLAGIDSQQARKHQRLPGFDDADRAFAEVPDGAPAILLAHEPDYFAQADTRALLQISGHTHGGQVNLAGWRPMTPSAHGSRFGWGHVREGGRHLIVSGGIGYSGLPLRLFQPPEITLVTLTGAG